MSKGYSSGRFFYLLLGLLLTALLAASAVAGGRFGGNSMAANPELQKKLELAKANEEFLKVVKERVISYREHELYQQRIRAYSAGEKMSAFINAVKTESRKRANTKALLKSFTVDRNALQGAGGIISGTISVEGQPPFGDRIEVYAFDNLGFFAGLTEADGFGTYVISGLTPGNYYVVTQSLLVDEFYDNVTWDFFRGWRDATLVTVSEGGGASGINFDLVRGALVTGKVMAEDGVTPLSDAFVEFQITLLTNAAPSLSTFEFTNEEGDYELHVPATGAVVIQASVEGFVPEYYDNAPDFENATPIVIASLEDQIGDINFSLQEGSGGPAVSGGHIEGHIFGPEATPLGFALVFAFNVADTSIAGLGFSDGEGRYEIAGLDAGTYILFANHILDFISPPAVKGEYYNDAETPAEAEPLQVAENDTLDGIDFTLDPGGAIAGNITDANSTALEGILVVALKGDILQTDKFFAENLDLGLGFSDALGDYAISGLSGGNYYLRTVSLIGPDLGDGPHAGLVLDEFYDNVQSLFDFAEATPVPVLPPDTTNSINFELDLAGGISGLVTEEDGSTPVQASATVLAFNAETGFPELAFSSFDSETGAYEIRPLATGSYHVLAFVQSDISEPIYIPQFYDGAADPETATPVEVTAPDVTANIDFHMLRAGGVLGEVFISTEFPIGADSLSSTFVAAFEANTGKLAGTADITFAGAYQILGLPPGDYKVGAFAGVQGYSATYFGGGGTFDDVNSTPVSVNSDELTRANIELGVGEGIISGNVSDLLGEPIPGVLVIAYDGTGHAVSAGVSGFDFATFQPLPSEGEYHITGLRVGSYYVRTFALFNLLGLVENFDLGGGNGDPLSIIVGLLGGDLLDLNLRLHSDVWYQNVPVPISLEDFDLFSLLFSFLLGGGNPSLALPLFDTIPQGATQIAVSAQGETEGIDFALPEIDLGDIISDVSENPGQIIPTAFELSQNYPNPFNPSTIIAYQVPVASDVQLNVFNILGQRIRVLFDGNREAGVYSAVWDGRNDSGEVVAAGLYFVRMQSEKNSVVMTRKILFVK